MKRNTETTPKKPSGRIKKSVVGTVEKIWLTTEEACRYLGVKRTFLDELRYNAEISYYQIHQRTILFNKNDIDKLVLKNKVI